MGQVGLVCPAKIRETRFYSCGPIWRGRDIDNWGEETVDFYAKWFEEIWTGDGEIFGQQKLIFVSNLTTQQHPYKSKPPKSHLTISLVKSPPCTVNLNQPIAHQFLSLIYLVLPVTLKQKQYMYLYFMYCIEIHVFLMDLFLDTIHYWKTVYFTAQYKTIPHLWNEYTLYCIEIHVFWCILLSRYITWYWKTVYWQYWYNTCIVSISVLLPALPELPTWTNRSKECSDQSVQVVLGCACQTGSSKGAVTRGTHLQQKISEASYWTAMSKNCLKREVRGLVRPASPSSYFGKCCQHNLKSLMSNYTTQSCHLLTSDIKMLQDPVTWFILHFKLT
jgi:hypothetical protein